MLKQVANSTLEYLNNMPKSLRKKHGQFFTSSETASFMASMFDLSKINREAKILDPGCGSGILSAALIERIASEHPSAKISLTCYENDQNILPVLQNNLKYIKKELKDHFVYTIIEDDYILSQSDDFNCTLLAKKSPEKYDYIISNPPYVKINRNHPDALTMESVVHGAPNLYFLFASMSLFNLKQDGEMVYIIPRSWTSGLYFKAFRQYLLNEGKLEHIHVFVSRNKVFDSEDVLQETIIIKVRKTRNKPDIILITSSNSNKDFNNITKLKTSYDSVVSGSELYVYLPVDNTELDIINKVNMYNTTLPEEGLKMKTGIVVDFRQWEELRKEPGDHILPLFYSQHIKNGRVNHKPSGKNYDWIIDGNPGLIQKNKNYVFIKRFTAKEEHRRLQCGVYCPDDFNGYDYISTQNKINYVDRIDGNEMDLQTTYGIYALLNSTLFDNFYRILNGSTQVNSTEINSIPFPPVDIIKKIGEMLLMTNDLSTANCDRVILEVAYG